ncbi:MAG: hypothetical protein JW884_12085 [Deltaproteobacteria bacterium]|nr:hypothetical protein [Deltaproteobacteria bacterium]
MIHEHNLCQPDEGKSCGACCGLYNYRDNSRQALAERLRRRTELFRQTSRTVKGLERFSRRIGETEPQEKLFEDIYCCEFLGFVDAYERRVGCLLHPGRNEGVDLRDSAFYGKDLCDGHYCPSYSQLTSLEQQSVIHSISDWYLYGIAITDIDLIKEYIRQVSDRIGETPRLSRVLENKQLLSAIGDFIAFRIDWPYRAPEGNRFGKYCFADAGYDIDRIDYESLGCRRSPYDRILVSLASRFQTIAELKHAESIIENNISRFAADYP